MSRSRSFRHSQATGAGSDACLPLVDPRGRQAGPHVPNHGHHGVSPPLGQGRNEGQGVETATLNQRNTARLLALSTTKTPADRLRLRNAIVHDNLPLVYAVVARMGVATGLPSDDLHQIGSIGLLKAVEAFDPSRGGQLSSFAVPYIRGAIQHELRDRHSLVRVPRELWDLRRRALALLERQGAASQGSLGPRQLAETIGCDRERLLEALQLSAVTEMRSLDAPLGSESGGDGQDRPLLDALPDPASLAPPSQRRSWDEGAIEAAGSGAQTAGTDCGSPRQRWLALRLRHLEPRLRSLLIGHFDGRSWVELGRDLDLHPRQAQRLTMATLSRLEAEARSWQETQPPWPLAEAPGIG